jgi:tetratricopeptide (TPR) repeat protein
VPVSVVHFRNSFEYKGVAPELSSGMVNWSGRHDFERAPIAFVEGDPWRHRDFIGLIREVLQHELTHVLIYTHFPQAPTWLNEGLAEYFSTLESDEEEGIAIMGRPPGHLGFRNGSWKTVYDQSLKRSVTLLPIAEVPSVRSLLNMGDEFYGAYDGEPGTPAAAEAGRRQALNYGGAWNLVHLLKQDPKYAPMFEAYLAKLRAGRSADGAWSGAFQAVSPDELEKDFRAALTQEKITALTTHYNRPSTGAPAVRTLSDAEVHLLFAQMRKWDTDESKSAALRDMNEGAARAPDLPQAALLRAYWSYQHENWGEADETLRKAKLAHPNDRQILNALGWVRLAALERKEHLEPKELVIAMEPVAAPLSRVAETATELDLLGRYHLMKGDYDRGLAYEKRAVAKDPSCSACLATSAELMAQKGLFRDAVEVATLALAVLPEGARSPVLEQRIARYKREGGSNAGSLVEEKKPAPRKAQ